jgi:multidrug transporter EmrE-like cation transporter
MNKSGGALESAVVNTDIELIQARQRRRSVLIVVACTLMGAAAQVLIKLGANQLSHASLIATFVSIFTVPQLFLGYCLYGVFAVLMVLALRHGELSILYPVIALTFVWVSILSALIFHEPMNAVKIIGIIVIVAGVAVLGLGSKR